MRHGRIRVLVIGGGYGRSTRARSLGHADVDVVLLDCAAEEKGDSPRRSYPLPVTAGGGVSHLFRTARLQTRTVTGSHVAGNAAAVRDHHLPASGGIASPRSPAPWQGTWVWPATVWVPRFTGIDYDNGDGAGPECCCCHEGVSSQILTTGISWIIEIIHQTHADHSADRDNGEKCDATCFHDGSRPYYPRRCRPRATYAPMC
jgi:choline dehydrogenase-like flavoprotein